MMCRCPERTVRRQMIPWDSRDLVDALTIQRRSFRFRESCAVLFRQTRRPAIRCLDLLHRSDKDGKWRQSHVIQINILLRTLVGEQRRSVSTLNSLRLQVV